MNREDNNSGEMKNKIIFKRKRKRNVVKNLKQKHRFHFGAFSFAK